LTIVEESSNEHVAKTAATTSYERQHAAQ